MAFLPKPVEELAKMIAKMPGMSRRGAERFLEWWWLREADKKEFGAGWEEFSRIGACQKCFFFSYSDLCEICSDKERDKSKVCVVSSSFTAATIAKEADYTGQFFVLGGEAISSRVSKTVETVKKRIGLLKKRISEEKIKEIIVATDFTLKGEATALFIKDAFRDTPVKISRLAQGFQTGSQVDYGDTTTLKKAMENREEY